jgi:glutamate-1-semialdehyde aminotransferase/spore coat polysaccharide biosynthesis protein SpsF (cytidylyltransferase family)
MKVVAVTQARYNSSRLPGKVLLKIGGKTLLQIHLERILKSERIDQLILATTFEQESNQLIEIARFLNISFFQGSTENVLDRFYKSVKDYKPDYVVRLTSDCPLVDPEIIDQVVDACISGGYDYCSNTLNPTFPDGMDVEVMKFSALEYAWHNAIKLSDKEHVTPFIWGNSTAKGQTLFKSFNYENSANLSQFRFTVDERDDFDLIEKIILTLGDKRSWKIYVYYLKENQDLSKLNSKFERNAGYMKSIQLEKVQLRTVTNFANSVLYRSKIHDLIPGGAHTYSKGDDQFPELAPAAIAYGKGSHVWDIDGNEYLDCSMGLTSVSLGHAHGPVLDRVKIELDNGVNFQRPSILEREMAEKFLSLVPGHDMVKFAKNGSIVTTAAVKLARAHTGRKLVAFPGDHPFYSYDDWFIGKTACNLGVPVEIANLSVTFKSCSIDSLRDIFTKYPDQIACVIMEPEKNACGNGCSCSLSVGEFLKQAIDLAHQHGALFIIDEMITGFKTALPGSLVKYGVTPDMATWGKGIANGFSFCALTGTKDVMELGGIRNAGKEKVFLISTTHGGETHSLAAGLATIDEYLKKDVISHLHKIGDSLIQKCKEAISKHDLASYVEVVPCNWMPVFVFRNMKKEICPGMRTFAMQEMIKRGVLFQGAFVPCFSHTLEDVNYLAEALDQTLAEYKRALERGYEAFLIGEPAKPVFRKYL